jgi:N,N-dimethylformamidase beta subunit-like protein/VCBS repeat protein
VAAWDLRLSRWATLDPATGWVIGAGAFFPGADSDLFAYQPGNGTLWVGRNRGDHFELTGPWATVDPAAGWQFVVADFTGDGRADVAGYHPSNGSVWVGENRGGTFELVRWTTLAPAEGWTIDAGSFMGTGRADLFAHHRDSGSLWVGENTGSAFAFSGVWATVDPAQEWHFAAGDFVGDGRSDVVGYQPGDGSLWVGQNHGSSFDLGPWGAVAPAAGWQVLAGRFTGRGKADLLAYHSGNGTLWIGENQGHRSFAFTAASATLTPAGGWGVVTGSVNGDLWDDVICRHPDDGSVWVGVSPPRPVEGYCWPLSARPGEVISFHMSHGGESTASFRRHTSTSATVESLVLDAVTFTAEPQPVPETPWRSGCDWDETFSLTVPPDWASGIYSAACTDSRGGRCDITFVVRPADDRRSDIAVLANANTWLAYNGWGGFSKYSGLARTSFLRPMPVAAPEVDPHLTRGELWILGWLESQGHPADVLTDIDFHDEGCDADQYRLLIAGTHPEYWSTQMYDNVGAYLDAGGSFAYLGGNGIFEIGEYDDDRTAMVFRLGVEGGAREDALFRMRGRPERSLVGVATERCSVVGSPYVVRRADHPLFAGTGLSNGDVFGNSGLNRGFGNGKASAWEVDTCRGVGATGIPGVCAMDEGKAAMVPPSELPPGLVVLAQGVPDGPGDENPGADMTYYDHPGGGFVFSAGSITFGGSLVVDPALSTLMHNVLERAGIP